MKAAARKAAASVYRQYERRVGRTFETVLILGHMRSGSTLEIHSGPGLTWHTAGSMHLFAPRAGRQRIEPDSRSVGAPFETVRH